MFDAESYSDSYNLSEKAVKEYLAKYLTEKGLFNSCKQKQFSLKNVNIPNADINNFFNNKNFFVKDFLEKWLSNN